MELKLVKGWPLLKGQMMVDRTGTLYLRCPKCGAISFGDPESVDYGVHCPECKTYLISQREVSKEVSNGVSNRISTAK